MRMREIVVIGCLFAVAAVAFLHERYVDLLAPLRGWLDRRKTIKRGF